MTFNEATTSFAEVAQRVAEQHEITTVWKDGKPWVRIIPAEVVGRSGKEIAEALRAERPRLSPEEADEFEADLRAIRQEARNQIFP